MAKVSIIIPVFNKEGRISNCIESVLNQTYIDIELVIINDGSTDRCHEIVQQYINKDSRIVYFKQSNQGVSIARNKGIELSSGEYISFLDADDELHPEFITKMLREINDKEVCYCGHYLYTEGKKCKPKFKFFEGDILVKYLYNICTPNTNSWLIKKKFLNKYNIRFSKNVNWGEDMIFFSKVLIHNKSIKFVSDHLSQYHLSNINCLSENSIDKIEKDIKWMEEVKKYLVENEKDQMRLLEAIEAINTYRLPGGIVYRIYSNLNNFEKNKLSELVGLYSNYIRRIKLTNGLRSIKLIYYKYKLLNYIKE